MAWKSCPVGRKRWRRKSMIPSDRLKFPPSSSKFARSCGSARFPFGFRQKISVWWNFLPEKRSENAGTDVKGIQKAKTATDVVHVRQGKELSGSPLFMPYPGMKPLFSPAVVKALLLPLHCICGLFCPYPRPPVLPALSLRKTAYRNGWRDTDFSGYGGTFRKKEWKAGYYLAV